MTVAEDIAEFARTVQYDDIPAETVAHTKRIILDQLSVQLACATLPWSENIYEGVTEMGGNGNSTVVRYGDELAPDDAAYINSAFGHAFEMDDISIKSINHVGCHAVPTALAVGQEEHITGREFVTAVALCSDLINRISGVASRTLLANGLNVHPPVNGFATAAAAARLLDLDEEQIRESISIAGSYSTAGLREYNQTGGSVKRVSGSIPTQSGIRAAYLAKNGVTAPPTVYEGKWGWEQFYIPDVEESDRIVNELGTEWHLLEVGFKAYCANYFTQPGIELALRLKEEHDIDPDSIESIEFGTFAETIQHAGAIAEPTDVLSAQYSAPFVIALAFIKGDVGFDQYTEENLTDPEILNLANNVELYVDEEAERQYQDAATGLSHSATMTVRLANGEEYNKRIQSAQIKGNLDNQLTDEEMRTKSRRLTEPIIGEQAADTLIERVEGIEDISDIDTLREPLIVSE